MTGFEIIRGKTKYDGYEIRIPNELMDIANGSYEIWDLDSNGYLLYEEGTLIFEDGELIDYDGMDELPEYIINAIARNRKISL